MQQPEGKKGRNYHVGYQTIYVFFNGIIILRTIINLFFSNPLTNFPSVWLFLASWWWDGIDLSFLCWIFDGSRYESSNPFFLSWIHTDWVAWQQNPTCFDQAEKLAHLGPKWLFHFHGFMRSWSPQDISIVSMVVLGCRKKVYGWTHAFNFGWEECLRRQWSIGIDTFSI